MDKDAFYFSHDSNARFDTKILKLRAKYGLEGYGFYFCLLEIMRDNSDYKLKIDDLDVVAFQLQIDLNKVKELIEFCLEVKLLIEKNEKIFSPSFLERMEQMNEKRKKRQEAGRKGGLSNRQTIENKQNESNAQAMLKQNESMKRKEKKEKEIKENNISLEKKIDPFFNPLVNEFKKEYKKVFSKDVYLNREDINRLNSLMEDIPDLDKTFNQVLIKLKNLNFDGINFKPSASWLLKDNHYTSILNGEYDKEEPKQTQERQQRVVNGEITYMTDEELAERDKRIDKMLEEKRKKLKEAW